MKKFFALLLSVMMMFTMLTPVLAEALASQYTALTPDPTTISHKLTLTDLANIPTLAYDIVYSYEVDDPVIIDENGDERTDIENALAVTGKPSIADITYGPEQLGDQVDRFPEEEIFTETRRTVNKTTTVNWDNVSIKQPGIYRWKVTQSVDTDHPFALADANNFPTNLNNEFYLFMYVVANDDTLTVQYFRLDDTEEPLDAKNTDLFEETFPPKTIDLTLTKTVSGDQASKDQYFPFTITLTAPAGVGLPGTSFSYAIEETTEGSYELKTQQTAYQDPKDNLSSIAVTNGATVPFTLWLKHGQSVTIKKLVYGSSYTISEGSNVGYDVNATVSGEDNDGVYEASKGFQTADASMTGDAVVSYENTKNAPTPTGIDLQSGAAFAGIILAMGLMIVMFIGKRKEQAC